MKISKKQLQVLNMLYEGKSIKEIANELNRSESTIKTHKDDLLRKFDVSSIRQILAKRIYELETGNVLIKENQILKSEIKVLKKQNDKLQEYQVMWEDLKGRMLKAKEGK